VCVCVIVQCFSENTRRRRRVQVAGGQYATCVAAATRAAASRLQCGGVFGESGLFERQILIPKTRPVMSCFVISDVGAGGWWLVVQYPPMLRARMGIIWYHRWFWCLSGAPCRGYSPWLSLKGISSHKICRWKRINVNDTARR